MQARDGGPEQFEQWYYQRISELWERQDKDYWNATRTFLFSESILLGAIGVLLSRNDSSHDATTTVVAVIMASGVILVAAIWIRVANRLTNSLRLTLHQARHIELEVFRDRFPFETPCYNTLKGFSMFFWGSYAVMPKNQVKPDDYPADGAFSSQLEAYKKHHAAVSDEEAWRGSAWNALGLHLPIAFVLVSMVVLASVLVLFDTSPLMVVLAIAMDVGLALVVGLYTGP